MKTKIYLTDAERKKFIPEFRRIRATGLTLRQAWAEAVKILPPDRQPKFCSRIITRLGLAGRLPKSSVSPHPLPTSQATASPAPVAPGRALLPGQRKYTPRRSARPGAIPPSARTAAPAVDRESAPNPFTPVVALLVQVLVAEVRRQLTPEKLAAAVAQPLVEAALQIAPPETDEKNPDTWDDKTLVREIAAARAANNLARWHRLVGVRRRRDKGGEFTETESNSEP